MLRHTVLRLLMLGCLCANALLPAAAARPSAPDSPQAPQATPWLLTARHADIAYFVFASPARVERYSLSTKAWLAAVPLTAAPTAFAVDGDGMYVSYGRNVMRRALDGSGETFLVNATDSVGTLLVNGQFLYVHHYSTIRSVNKQTGAAIASTSVPWGLGGLSLAPGRNKLYGRNIGISPSDIHHIVLNADGTFGASNDSPYHGDYPHATKTFVFAGEARVTDNSGIVYNASDLTYNNSLGGTVDDIAFYGNLPIVLRGTTLIAYSPALLETGRVSLAAAPLSIYVAGETIFRFAPSDSAPNTVAVAETPVAALNPAQPGQPVNPDGLAYVPDSIDLGNDGVIYLLSRADLSVFRWSIAQRRYLATIPLSEAPALMTYSGIDSRLYLAYAGGRMTVIELASGLTERQFANAPLTPCGLATAGRYVFICAPVGAWASHITYTPEGALIAQKDWNYHSLTYAWSEVNRKMYFLRDGMSPNDLLWETINPDGTLGQIQDSPYHGDNGVGHPVRVAPNGSVVLLGSGWVYDATTLAQVNALSNTIADAVWAPLLSTVRANAGGTELQQWADNYGLVRARQTEGAPLRVFKTSDGIAAVTNYGGAPRFTLWNETLQPIYASPTMGGLVASNNGPNRAWEPTQFSANLAWGGGAITYRWAFGDGDTATGQNVSHTYMEPGVYVASVAASNASATISATTTVTVTLPDYEPPTAPANLRVTATSATAVSLAWNPATDNAGVTGYTIYSGTQQLATTAQTSFSVTQLRPETSYVFSVRASDRNGNLSPASNTVTAATARDLQAPTTPGSLRSAGKTDTSISLAWNASTDNVGVAAYAVYRNGALVRETAGLTMTVAGLQPLTTYAFTVTARDAAMNRSAASAALNVTTAASPDTQAPTAPGNLRSAGATVSTISLAWNASTDNVGVIGYRVYSGTQQLAAIPGTAYTVSGLAPATRYDFSVRAFDQAGNLSPASAISADTAPDLQAPAAPAQIWSPEKTDTRIDLAWSASADNVGVTGYRIYRDGSFAQATQRLTATLAGLAPSTTYTFTVRAEDAAGNLSAPSVALAVTTFRQVDTQAPQPPANLRSSAVLSTSVDLAWDPAIDNVGVVSYRIYKGQQFIGGTAGLAFRVGQLAPGASHTFVVRALDEAGNLSAPSNILRVTTQAPPDTQAPTAPGDLAAAEVTPTSIRLAWTPSIDNVGVSEYKIYSGTLLLGTTQASGFTIDALAPSTPYRLSVRAVDAANNLSPEAAATVATADDEEAPTAPTAPSATSSAGRLLVSWRASGDNVGVVAYHIYADAELVATTTGTSHAVTGLQPGRTYLITIRAADAAGNLSPPSAAVTATAPAPGASLYLPLLARPGA
ncbi:MAG TPA: fibronectin type III domain-containing protein, partial [Herpetosiphonaceae bacterium]